MVVARRGPGGLREIFDAYEAKNEGVTDDFKTFKATEYNKILATGLSGSDGPDVPQVRSYGQLQPTVASGSLVPLDDEIDLEAGTTTPWRARRDRRLPVLRAARDPDGPDVLQQGLLEEKGLGGPTSWEDFVAMNDALLADEITPIAVGAKDDWTLPIVHEVLAARASAGRDFQDAVATGEKDFTDPDWVASVQVVGDLKKYMPKDVTGLAATDARRCSPPSRPR